MSCKSGVKGRGSGRWWERRWWLWWCDMRRMRWTRRRVNRMRLTEWRREQIPQVRRRICSPFSYVVSHFHIGYLPILHFLIPAMTSYQDCYSIECSRSYGRWCRQIRAHYTGASWHTSLAVSHCADTVQDCCFDLRLCPRYWSCLPQASNLPSLELFTSVTPFGWPRRLVCFAGKHCYTSIGQRSFTIAAPVHWNALPPDIRSPLNSRRQFRSNLKTYLFRQAYNTPWFLWEQFVEECNAVTVGLTVTLVNANWHSDIYTWEEDNSLKLNCTKSN